MLQKSQRFSEGALSKEFREFFESAEGRKKIQKVYGLFNKYTNSDELP
ncbi:MAG TPA: hypothetical protein VF242_02690 [Nitrososphaeraceae archaeon]